MVQLRSFFSTHEDAAQILLYAVIITLLWFAEVLVTTDGLKSKWRHSSVNLLFIFTALPVQLLLTGFIVIISKWANIGHWGILNLIHWRTKGWGYYLTGFVLLDLCEYLYHVIMHKFDVLWKFHLVHHSDLKVDVSTTVREHPGETFIRTCFLTLWVFILGPVIGVLIIRQIFQTFSNIIAHTEFRLSNRSNKIISFLFITPNLHHVHHHYRLPYTDCNYGDVLSIWDRLFGTYGELDREDTNFGIDTHMDENVNGKFINVVRIPFQKLERKEHPGDQI
ncbi:MAG: sterol desaturase family protein [Mucilaginibacter sp.]|nr:sterol desaturase family protein [Mucilaginibacter sp.]